MEAIGGVASILTLIQAAGLLAQATRELVVRLKHAPEELCVIEAQLLTLEAELGFIKQTFDNTDETLIDEDIQRQIQKVLIEVRNAVAKIEMSCASAQGNQHFQARVRWMSKGKKYNEELLAQLRAARDSLMRIVSLVTLRGNTLLIKKVVEMSTSMKEFQVQLSGVNSKVQDDQVYAQSIQGKEVAKTQTSDRRLDTTAWTLDCSRAVLGVSGSLIAIQKGHCNDYNIAMRVSIPLTAIVGPYALLACVSVRTFPLCPGKFRLLRGGTISFSRVVDEDHPFILACDRGDLSAVRDMLLSGEGRTSDIDAKNWNPLAYAIRSGNVDVVKELIKHGADLDGTFGQQQTTPLLWAIQRRQLDIVRYLLREGASQDPINGFGWNAMFCCWPSLRRGKESCIEILNLLEQHAYQDLDATDVSGWTVLHRVAAHATPSEVLRLIAIGADPVRTYPPLQWNAIHHAVFYGNYPAFVVLLPFYGDVVTLTDERGWTLLHVAASAGHSDIVRHLLQLGADPTAMSWPYWSKIPESIYGRTCTPQEVAAAQSMEREQLYVDTVRQFERYRGHVGTDIMDDGDACEFIDAVEQL